MLSLVSSLSKPMFSFKKSEMSVGVMSGLGALVLAQFRMGGGPPGFFLLKLHQSAAFLWQSLTRWPQILQ